MQRAAGGFDYRLRLVVPDLQPIDELEPASCTRKCLAAETLRGHSAECGGVARPLQNGRRRSERRVLGRALPADEYKLHTCWGDSSGYRRGVHKA